MILFPWLPTQRDQVSVGGNGADAGHPIEEDVMALHHSTVDKSTPGHRASTFGVQTAVYWWVLILVSLILVIVLHHSTVDKSTPGHRASTFGVQTAVYWWVLILVSLILVILLPYLRSNSSILVTF